MKARKPARALALCALFTALMAVGAQISLPLPLEMRLTLQMPAVLLCGLALGPKKAAASAAAYLALGLAGLPVFANFSGGLAYALRPSFGFAAAFVPAAFVTGLISEKEKKAAVPVCMAAVGAGFAIVYAVGIAYHFLALALWMRAPQGFAALFLGAGYPLLLLKDLAAAALAALLGPKLKKYGSEDETR